MTTLSLIHRRRAEIEKEIQECRDRISALQAELPELEVAARVIARLGNQESPNVQTEIEDDIPLPPVPAHAKPANIPTMPDMILEALDRRSVALFGGLEPADIRDFIAKKWWPEVRPDVVGPIAWRMWKRGQLRKNGAKYLLPEKNEPAGTPSESAPTGSKPEPSFHEALFGSGAKGREAGPGGGT